MKHFAAIALLLLALALGTRAEDAPTKVVSASKHGLNLTVDGVSKTNYGDVKDVVDEQVALTPDSTVTDPLVDDLAFFITQRYHDLGYFHVVVAWEVKDGAGLLHVKEGEPFKVGTITYEGNTTADTKELDSYMLRATHEKLGTSGPHVAFVKSDLRSGAQLVQRYFQGLGYLDATVDEPEFIPHPETSTQDVKVKIHEGPKYICGTITVTGDLRGKDKEVKETYAGFTGQPFSEVKLTDAAKKMKGIYEKAGYFKADVAATAHPKAHQGGEVPMNFVVNTGERFRVAKINISPQLSKGAQRIVRANIRPAEGHLYITEDIEIMQRRMMNTDVFKRLDLNPKPISDDTLELDITGEESLKHRLSLYGGYETFMGPILGSELRDVNFYDTGDAAKIKAEYTGQGINGGVGLVDPAIFNTGFSLDTEITAQTFSPYNDYTRRSLGLRMTLARQWTKHITTSLYGEYTTNKTTSTMLTDEELGPQSYSLGTLGATITLDYRDSPVLPTKGWYVTGSIADSIGGSIEYLRTDVKASYYLPLTKKLRTAFTAQASAIDARGGIDALPIDLRLYNGGANSVRSFGERLMGPESITGVPLGGTATDVFSAEISYEIMPNLELALFGDAGSLSGVPKESTPTLPRPTGLRYAIGPGLRYKLPFGPLRIDYGVNPTRKEGEAFGALQITFGFAF